MATEEDMKSNIQASKKRIEFLASCLDNFLQDFLTKAAADDRLGTLIASARVAQMGQVLVEEFQANAGILIDGATDLVAANRAAEIVLNMVNKNAGDCNRMIGDEAVPVTTPTPDRSLS